MVSVARRTLVVTSADGSPRPPVAQVFTIKTERTIVVRKKGPPADEGATVTTPTPVSTEPAAAGEAGGGLIGQAQAAEIYRCFAPSLVGDAWWCTTCQCELAHARSLPAHYWSESHRVAAFLAENVSATAHPSAAYCHVCDRPLQAIHQYGHARNHLNKLNFAARTAGAAATTAATRPTRVKHESARDADASPAAADERQATKTRAVSQRKGAGEDATQPGGMGPPGPAAKKEQ